MNYEGIIIDMGEKTGIIETTDGETAEFSVLNRHDQEEIWVGMPVKFKGKNEGGRIIAKRIRPIEA